MGTTTINTFPPLHSYDSPRSWLLALAALLHIGFFWALSAGLIVDVAPDKPHISELVPVDPVMVEPRQKVIPDPDRTNVDIYVPQPPKEVTYEPRDERSRAPTHTSTEAPTTASGEGPRLTGPAIQEPRVDSRYLTEPAYPPSEIRGEHEGTVVLSVQVLGNGRVGEVRIHQSSGREKLDQSAAREARRWRFTPGMRDGIPATMWKTIPVKFTLQDRNRWRRVGACERAALTRPSTSTSISSLERTAFELADRFGSECRGINCDFPRMQNHGHRPGQE